MVEGDLSRSLPSTLKLSQKWLGQLALDQVFPCELNSRQDISFASLFYYKGLQEKTKNLCS